MKNRRQRRNTATRAMARGSLVIVVLIVVSIVLLSGYGTYKYIPQVHSEVRSIIHPSTTTASFASFPTTSVHTAPSTTITITQPVEVSTQGGTTVFYATSETTESTTQSTTQTTSLPSSQTTTQSTTQSTGLTSTSSTSQQTLNSTSQSTQSYPFVLNGSPTVYLTNNQAFLNVSYANTQDSNMSVYEHVVLTSTSGVTPIGSPLFHIVAYGTMSLSLELGDNLPPGDYLVTFYVVNNSTGQQVSESVSIHFQT